MKKIFALIAVILVAFTLVACNKDKTATGYGLVHGHYVGVIDVTVDSKGVVKDVKIEEYYLAYNAAQVAEPTTAREDVMTIGTTFFAKYFNVDGKIFVGNESKEYTHPTHGLLEDWVKVEANAKAYVEAVKAGKVYISTSTGTKITDLTTAGNAATAMTKSESGYGGTRWDWKAAMEGVQEILIGTKMNPTFALTDGKWVVDGVTTGATLVDFADYVDVAKRAYATATK